MKKQIILAAILALPLMGYAQKEKLQQDITQYSVKIDSLVTVEKNLMGKEMDALDAEYRAQKISQEEWRTGKTRIAEKYQAIINQKLEKENHQLQHITKEAALHSVFHKSQDTLRKEDKGLRVQVGDLSVKINKKNKTPEDYLRSDDLAVSYSFLNLTREKGSLNPFETDSQMRIGNSHSFEIQARRERQLGSVTSPFFIRYGLAYRSDTYMPKRPQVFVQQNQHLMLEDFTGGELKRSKLRNVYLTLPVDFQWVLNPRYTEFEGRNYLDARKKQWRLGVGVYAGVNLRSIVKVKYYDPSGSFKKYDFTLDDGVNPFLFGAKISLRYGGFNIFIKKDLTPVFNGSAFIPAKNGIQIGVDIMDINF